MLLLRRFSPVLVLLASVGVAAASENYTYHHDPILGTSLEIQVQADSEAAAQAAEAKILAEIARLSAIFSTYDAHSEFSRWQQTAQSPTKVSPELFAMLSAADDWRRRSGGAFEPGVEALSQLWRTAQQSSRLPASDELSAAVKRAGSTHWHLDKRNLTAQRTSDCPLTLNAIAKGAIVEWACQAACQSPAVKGLVVNLGGDLRVCGQAVREVRIANPTNDAVNAPPLAQIFVTASAVATSGNYRRGFRIGEQWFSHIIDPRTGAPASEVISATVVAPSSTTADALATACNVLSVTDALSLVHSESGTECLLVTRDGKLHPSPGWSDLTMPRLFRFISTPAPLLAQANASPAADKPAAEPTTVAPFEVQFELNRPGGGRYRRPYVAVWLEDADEFPVKTALLFMQTQSPGPRWHRDLLRWYRNDGVRKLADGTELIGVVSGATRNPGEYKALFDGRDDAGRPLKPGKYTLYLEAAREHGTYQLIRHTLTLGKEPLPETKLKSNVEIKSAVIAPRP